MPAAAEPGSRPGLTSLVRTSRGLMTIQTELVGDPPCLTTIVDFRGRVLKRWTEPFTPGLDDASSSARIRKWHGQIEARVRDSLARAAQRRSQPPRLDEATSRLFLAGMRAYAKRDFAGAHVALRACARLLPNDPRVQAALRRVSE